MRNLPYAFPRFLIGCVHLPVACNVERYNDLNKALLLGNTVLWIHSVQDRFSSALLQTLYQRFDFLYPAAIASFSVSKYTTFDSFIRLYHL